MNQSTKLQFDKSRWADTRSQVKWPALVFSLALSVGFEKRKLKRRKKGSSHIILKHPILKGMMNFQKK